MFTISYSGFVNDDDESAVMIAPSMTTSATVSSGTGTYAVKASDGYAENYTFIYADGTLTIGTASGGNLYISGSNRNVTVDDVFTLYAYYGNQSPEVEWTSSDEAVAKVDIATGKVTILKSGRTTITATVTDNNFNGESAGFELEASKKRISIKAPANELVKTYTGEAQYINFTSNDIDLKDKGIEVNASYVLLTDSSVTEPKQAGTYTVSYEIDDERYTADGNVTLTINKANVRVKFKDDNKVYGDEYTGYSLEYTDNGGLSEDVSADVLERIKSFTTYACDGAAVTTAVKTGGYEIILTLSQTETDNVRFTVDKGVLTVTKALLTI